MTDASSGTEPGPYADYPVPVRIGGWVDLVDGEMVGHLRTNPSVTRHGSVDPTALMTLVDMMGGLACDDDLDHWVFTSNLSVRAQPITAPAELRCRVAVLRKGARSSTSQVFIHDAGDASLLAVGLASFSRVPRRDTDLPKPVFDLETVGATWSQIEPLDRPIRVAAGLRVVDAAAGHVELDVVPLVCNPAGAVHGAMIGMLAESAAEELVTAALGGTHLAADVDLRYLAQARVGPVATRARFVGDPANGSVIVELVDRGKDDLLLTIATVRTYAVTPGR